MRSRDLSARYSYVYIYPFRAYYNCESNVIGAKGLTAFNVTYDDLSATTGIDLITKDAASSLAIQSIAGGLVLRANNDVDVKIFSSSGQPIFAKSLKMGQQTELSLTSGIYVVNGKKVAVY